jgi:hypothetical protein
MSEGNSPTTRCAEKSAGAKRVRLTPALRREQILDAALIEFSAVGFEGATFRLLISESGRAPERIRRWHDELVTPYTMQRQSEITDSVNKGLLPDNLFTRKFSLLSSPALLAMLGQLLGHGATAGEELAEVRQAHREMLLILLTRTGK